jgi:CheY-like chemotaxis protein
MFSKQRQSDSQIVQLNTLVLSVAELLRRTLGDHVSLTSSLEPELWQTQVDASQLQNAIVNLAVNARDAMPNGGRLIIETRNAFLEAGQLGADVAPGEYVHLSVSDTGTGMPAEVRERVFEPFFTTKEKGRGTGLGLAMVYGFVRQSNGHISLYSEVGHGTTFNVYLPRVEGKLSAPISPETAQSGHQAKSRVVLVVEDDPAVRELTLARLKAIGYGVVEAPDGPKAIEILKDQGPVDLVLTDLVMPGGLSGRDVAILARELRPGIKVMLTSGYAEDIVRDDDPQLGSTQVLRKPYRQADLVAALRELFKP